MYPMTAEGINAHFQEIIASLSETFGDKFNIPFKILDQRQEECRHAWIAYYAATKGTRSPDEAPIARRRKSKTALLGEWLNTQIGQVVTPIQMGEACEGSKATGHAFVNANRSMFKKVGPGKYEVLDVAELRKLAGRPVVKGVLATVTGRLPAKPTPAEPDIDNALAQVMGHGKDDDWSWM